MKFLTGILFLLCLSSCINNDSYTPKRKGYFRIAFPERKYLTYSAECPFTFNYPAYASVVKDDEPNAEPCWLNVVFPQFRAKIYLSYKVVDNNLNQYLEETRMFAIKHEVKASAINESAVTNPAEHVYGLIYDIQGNAASNVQFYLTDSTRNFIRGALYFYSTPNKDSIEPVLQFIKKDVYTIVQSFRWKEDTLAHILLRGSIPPVVMKKDSLKTSHP
ncbi:MAG: gliding motility lipoprotein GldD [Bacteroidia bacterium]